MDITSFKLYQTSRSNEV